MHPRNTPLTDIEPSKVKIIREITRSDASSIFEVDMDGKKYALKLFHNNGDPGYTEKGRDLNRFRCESNAYEKLFTSGVCERSFVPKFYGSFNQVDPAAFYPAFQHFAHDKLKRGAILLEYLPNTENLNCVNYSDALYSQAVEGMKEIHRAGVLHRDIYPRNMLLVRGGPDRLVWIDFDVATTFTNFGPEEKARCDHEIALVEGLGAALVRAPSLPMQEISRVLIGECRERTKMRDFPRIQNFIEGFITRLLVFSDTWWRLCDLIIKNSYSWQARVAVSAYKVTS